MEDAREPAACVGYPNDAERAAGRAADGGVGGHGRCDRRGHFTGHFSHARGHGEVRRLARAAGCGVVRHGARYSGRRALFYRAGGAVSASRRRICLPAQGLWPARGVSLWMDGRGGDVSRRGRGALRGHGALCAGAVSSAGVAGEDAAGADSACSWGNELRGNAPEQRRDDCA
jgi:hypothetical protein